MASEPTRKLEGRPSLAEAPTEAVLESARHLDRLSVGEVLELIHREDGEAWAAVGRASKQIAEAVDVLVCAVGGGGRWFNVGAGTSGRMGVLDASEVPPTFGMPPRCVQAIIAGGERALRHSVEGAEDDARAAEFELYERGLALGDAVVAISASGHTPYALGAVAAAQQIGARSIAITCVPGSPLAESAELAIVVEVGPEVVTGSTRMKGGLAQKMVLHQLSTTVMVQLGRVEGSYMTNIGAVSQKLRSRAERILMTLASVDGDTAHALLDRHDGRLDAALAECRKGG